MNELLATPPHKGSIECIESWHDENGNWYRIYSDGWCEQGGVHTTNISNGINTVALFKSYINTNYSVIFNHETDNTTYYSYVGYPTSYQKTVDSWNYTSPANLSLNPRIRWEAKGYIM